MLLFAFGLIVGVALGMVVIGFMAIRAYDRGYDDALERRQAWRTELLARQAVAAQGSVVKRAS